ncbi:MAG: TetR/AcrR family transcriptional regulator [Deltaproteobacteria bacterium]|jgi:AcrR family transcriptional regulator|nr:TetR/AcrR family transcriptional regulator [Deltaproteobacteria bacterium]
MPKRSKAQLEIKPKRVGRPLNSDNCAYKQAILDAAIWVFSEKGLAASTIKEVSRRAEVTPALVHYHFGDKNALMEKTLDHFLPPLSERIWSAVNLDCEPLEMLKEIHRRLQEVIESSPWIAPLWSRELASESGRLRGYMSSLLDQKTLDRLVSQVKLGQKQGTINPKLVPELVFSSIIGGLHFPILTRAVWEKNFKTRKITVAMTLEHIRAMADKGFSAGKATDDE